MIESIRVSFLREQVVSLIYNLYMICMIVIAAEAVRSVFGPFVELVKSLNLPDWLVHWGHPGNMVFLYLMLFSAIF